MSARIDHLVVAAATLEQGADWCEKTLGVTPAPGGKHAGVGTHNRLLSIAGDGFAQAYLEIIALDPDAPPPQRPTWFGLGDAAMQARLRERPRLVQVLYSTARHFRSDHIYVVAGYRAPRIARKKGNPKSAHKRGVACDFRLDGVRIEAIRDYLRDTYHNVGVGYYPNSGFIHVDYRAPGEPSYRWTDYSGPGSSHKAKGKRPGRSRPKRPTS